MQITFNGGAQWSDLQKPDTYNYPECNRCKDLADTKCQLHLHGPTGWVEGPGDFLLVLLSGCCMAYTMKKLGSPLTQIYLLTAEQTLLASCCRQGQNCGAAGCIASCILQGLRLETGRCLC